METLKSFAGFVMRSPLTAAMVVAMSAILAFILPPATSLISFLSGASLSLVTLRRGPKDGLLVVGLSTVIFTILVLPFIGTIGLTVAILFVLWIPLWLLSIVLRITVSLSLVITLALVLLSFIVSMIHLIIGDLASWWRIFLIDTFTRIGPEPGPELSQLIDGLSQVMTGLVTAGILIGLIGNLLLARWWQSLLYNPGGFADEFLKLRLHPLVGVIALGVIYVTQFGPSALESLGIDLVVIMMAVFFIIGLAVIHGINANFGEPVGWLIGIYVLTFIFPRQMMTILAATGLADTWVDLRGKIKRNN